MERKRSAFLSVDVRLANASECRVLSCVVRQENSKLLERYSIVIFVYNFIINKIVTNLFNHSNRSSVIVTAIVFHRNQSSASTVDCGMLSTSSAQLFAYTYQCAPTAQSQHRLLAPVCGLLICMSGFERFTYAQTCIVCYSIG